MRKDPSATGDWCIGETAHALNPHAQTPIPSRTKSRFERVGEWLTCAGAAIACGIALFNFGIWWWWQDWRIGAARDTVPMAPSTALILMILGGALLVRQRWGEKTAVRLIGFVAAGIAAAPAVIAGLQHVTGIGLAWEHVLLRTDDTVRGIPVGQISPLSAGAFLLAAISLAALLPPLAERRLFHRVGLVTASLGVVASLIIALAYASGTPLFYGGGIIPMAFLTAIAFAALFLALLTAAASGTRRRAGDTGAPLLYPASSWLGTERHLLIVFGVLVLAIGLAGFFALRVRQTAMRERIADELQAIADLKVSQIVNWQNERLGDARVLMHTPSLARSAAALFSNPDSAAASAEILAYISTLRNNYRYEAIVLFDDRMNPRLAVPRATETSGPRLHALLEAVPGSGDVLVSDLHRGVSGGIHMDFVAPLRDLIAGPADQNSAPTPSAIGALLLRIDPRDFLYPLIQKWPVPSETAETLLVRREGDEVVYLNDLRHQRGTALTLRRSINDQQMPAVMGARGMFGVTEGVDYRGVEVLAAVRAVPGSPWILVAKEDQSEIYAPLRRQALAMAATVMSLLLGAAFGVAYLSRQTNANFLRHQLATETERRSLAERLALITRHANDIILLSDENGRIIEANDRALTTYGYTLDELRQLPPGGLRPLAARDSLPRHSALFNSVDGTVFETVHQRKDGTVFAVEVSGRSIEIEGRKVRLGIFRDITARKHAEEARRRAEEQYRSIFENAVEGIYQSTPQGTFLTANPAMARILGYASSEALIRERTDIARQGYVDPRRREEFTRRIEADGVVSGFEYEAYRKDGSKVWVSENARVVRDGHGRVACYEGILDDITAQKRAEQALENSLSLLQATFESTADGLLVVNQTGRIVQVNQKFAEMWRIPADILSSHDDRRAIAFVLEQLKTPGSFVAKVQELYAQPEAVSFDVLEFKDGRTFERYSQPQKVGGTSVGRVWSFRDITERKRAESVMRESERRLLEMMENLELIALTLDTRGVVTFCNDFLLRVTGWKREELIGHSWFDHSVPDSAKSAKKVFFDALGVGNIPPHHQNPIKTKTGELREISWSNTVLRDGAGNVVGTASIGEDVTDRLRALAALRQSEERYRQLFEHNPLPMWLYDLETLGFLAVNESAIRDYGYSREEFLGMTIKQIRPEEDVPAMLQSVADVQAGGRSSGDDRHRRKDGTIFHVEIISGPLMFEGRKARLVLAADTTEKKLLEEKFLHAQRLESVGMLAAGIAHDLNNVLAPIVFAAPMLRASLTDPRDVQVLDTLEKSAGRGAGLVKQILGFVHSTTGEFQPTQVKYLAQDIIGVIEETFPKSIQIEHQIPSNLWPVQGNATQIHQVLLNLCVNARDAMPQGGTLRFTAANRRLDAAQADAIPGARPGAWLVLEVSDTGTGISPEVLEHIWTPFFTTKGVGRGTGLGLSTVRGILASHRGFVELQTEIGRGSTFRVFFPAVEKDSPRPVSAARADTPDGHGELILLVDDDAAIRHFVSTILQHRGYRVVSCADGVEAIADFTTHRAEIALVITDVDMPRLGGVALARALLQLCPDIRLLAMSGLSRGETDGSDIPAIKQLAHAFLLKPFTFDDLLGVVHQLLHPAEKS